MIEGVFGQGKPERAVFEHAIAATGVDAASAWHVGDNLYADVGGALGAGVHAVWIHRDRLELREDIPHVPDEQRVDVQPLGDDFYRLTVHYGFKDEPDLPAALELASGKGMEFNLLETSFFLSRQTLVPTPAHTPGMALWREKLFAAMSRNASSATAFFKIPANRVVELGTRIEL